MIKELSISKITENLGECSELVRLLKLSGFYEGLQQREVFTVFAPVDGAFRQLPGRMTESLLKPENIPALRSLLGLHLIKGRYDRQELVRQYSISNLTGVKMIFAEVDGELYVNNSRVIESDKLAGNGVVHIIDRVLLPSLKR